MPYAKELTRLNIAHHKNFKHSLGRLSVDKCFFCPEDRAKTLHNSVYEYGQRHQRKFTVWKVSKGFLVYRLK